MSKTVGKVGKYDIRLFIDSQLAHVRLLGSAVRGIGRELELPGEQVGQLELMLVEAVNNVIEHAYENRAGHDVRVRVECDPAAQIKMIISDQGHSIPNAQIKTQLAGDAALLPEPESLPEGGWGLGLISMLADSLHYECDQEGNHLHLCKQLA